MSAKGTAEAMREIGERWGRVAEREAIVKLAREHRQKDMTADGCHALIVLQEAILRGDHHTEEEAKTT